MMDVQIPPHLVEKVNAIVAELIQEEEGEQAPAKEVTCAACDNVRELKNQRIARNSASPSKMPVATSQGQDTTAVHRAYPVFKKGS